MPRKSFQEGVIIICEGESPAYMVMRKDADVRYYKLTEMGFGDHAEMLRADAAK